MSTSTVSPVRSGWRRSWPGSWPWSWEPLRRHRQDLAWVAVAVVLVGLGVGLGLGLSAGTAAPPDTGAARLVPAGALAYLNVSLDRSRPGVRRARRLASRLPGFSAAQSVVDSRVAALVGTDHPAWLGDEAALAVLSGSAASTRAGSLTLFSVRRVREARRALAGLPASGAYRGVQIRQLPGGSHLALLGRYVVAGQLASVQAAIDVAHGSASLASSSAYRRAAAGEPTGRVLDLYAPAAGLSALLNGRGGVLGAVRTLLQQPGLTGVSASLSTAPGGMRLQVHRVFAGGGAGGARSAAVSGGSGGGGAADASLLRRLPASSEFALDEPGLPHSAQRLLAAAAQIGVGNAIGPLLSRLGPALLAEHLDVAPLLALFSHPTAVSVVDDGGRPDLLLLTHTSHPHEAGILLANAAPALVSLFPAASVGPGVTPLFTGRQINGMTIHQLSLGPGLQLDYSIDHNLVAISTSQAAIASLARSGGSLGRSAAYHTAFGSSPSGAGSLVFADLKGLIRLGEQSGLLRGAAFARLAPDLDRVSVIGLRAKSDQTQSTSELYFKIS